MKANDKRTNFDYTHAKVTPELQDILFERHLEKQTSTNRSHADISTTPIVRHKAKVRRSIDDFKNMQEDQAIDDDYL